MFKELNLLQIDQEMLEIKRIIEALLFSASDPISLAKFKEIIQVTHPINIREIRELIAQLQSSYEQEKRALQIDLIADGYILRTTKEMRPYIELLHANKRGEKLSKASMEILAIIAYKQPITRSEIEGIRGVDCSGTITSLLERDLIVVVGRKEAAGRPALYGVSKHFLHHFGINNVKDLNRMLFPLEKKIE